MRVQSSAIALLLAASFAAGCGRGSDSQTNESDSAADGTAGAQPANAARTSIDRGDGLTVEITSDGTGAEVGASSRVSLSYRAFLDGADRPFDASDEAGVPLELKLGPDAQPRVIEGLSRGLVGLRAGARAKLHIPAELGWGSAGNPQAGVPADSKLLYEVHVLDVR